MNPPIKTTMVIINHSNRPKIIIIAKKLSIKSHPYINIIAFLQEGGQ
jgi:hypothetical protein